MQVIAYKCKSCKDLVYSRARHDFRYCSCGEIAVDGGFDYTRVVYKDVMPKETELEIDASKKDLYNDWNTGVNAYGIVKGSVG